MTTFSLVVPTIHRTVELERLLRSLQGQGSDFEVLVVDQNADDRVADIVERFAGTLNLIRLPSSSRGAAKARNVGLEAASGDIVAFPDDDAWYPPGLLTKLNELFTCFPEFSGFCVRGADENGNHAGIRWLERPAVINRFNVWRTSIEFSMFLRSDAVSGLRFNEQLGPGATTSWGCGEGSDLLLRMLARGCKFKYVPHLVVHHPSSLSSPPSEAKTLAYARGLGRVLHLNGYAPIVAAVLCFGPFARAAIGAARFDFRGAALHSKVALSRFAGYCSKV
jgi:glycosyltransferase involved in cell wall biosynthesis